MKRFSYYAKLALVNVLVFLALIGSLNLLASVGLDVVYFYKRVFAAVPEKAYGPSLPDEDLARLVFRERSLSVREYVPYVGWARKPCSGRVPMT